MSDVLDIFAAPTTPRFQQDHPALVRARLAWSARRPVVATVSVQGVRVGDKVAVELKPKFFWSGVVTAWRKGERALALQSATVAEIRLDPGHPDWSPSVLVRRRDRIFPLRGPHQ